MIVEGIVTVEDELLKIIDIANKEKVKTLLQIGFNDGTDAHSFIFLFDQYSICDDSLHDQIYLIDIGKNVPKDVLKDIDLAMNHRWTFIDGDPAKQSTITSVDYLLNGQKTVNKDGVEKFMPGWGKPLDMLYIDGNHEALGPMRDYVNYSPFVKPGGLIVFMELNYPNVLRIYKELLDELKPEHWELIATENHEIISHGIGIIKKPAI